MRRAPLRSSNRRTPGPASRRSFARVPRILLPIKPAPLGPPLVRSGPRGGLGVGTEQRLDPINELSVEWAVRALESGRAKSITAVSVGDSSADVALRAARARGCPDLLRIDSAGVELDVATVAALLAAAARRVDAAVVVVGHESFDASSGSLA